MELPALSPLRGLSDGLLVDLGSFATRSSRFWPIASVMV
jgi:hypothetical protein